VTTDLRAAVEDGPLEAVAERDGQGRQVGRELRRQPVHDGVARDVDVLAVSAPQGRGDRGLGHPESQALTGVVEGSPETTVVGGGQQTRRAAFCAFFDDARTRAAPLEEVGSKDAAVMVDQAGRDAVVGARLVATGRIDEEIGPTDDGRLGGRGATGGRDPHRLVCQVVAVVVRRERQRCG
jgi:hypothetical protein